MRRQFNEAKATQAAGRLLKLRGGRMSHMKLIKLLYLVDREALLRWGRPVTTDRYVSMDQGPVLSTILNLINEGHRPASTGAWTEYISEPQGYEVVLLKAAPSDELSRAEEDLIAEVFRQHGGKSRWDMVELVHALPEWQDPNGSAIPITYADILAAGGKSPLETAAVVEELESLMAADSLLRPA
ncbi:MAG: Panacea domain-containing protein [Acidobacteriota bacterium]